MGGVRHQRHPEEDVTPGLSLRGVHVRAGGTVPIPLPPAPRLTPLPHELPFDLRVRRARAPALYPVQILHHIIKIDPKQGGVCQHPTLPRTDAAEAAAHSAQHIRAACMDRPAPPNIALNLPVNRAKFVIGKDLTGVAGVGEKKDNLASSPDQDMANLGTLLEPPPPPARPPHFISLPVSCSCPTSLPLLSTKPCDVTREMRVTFTASTIGKRRQSDAHPPAVVTSPPCDSLLRGASVLYFSSSGASRQIGSPIVTTIRYSIFIIRSNLALV